MVHERSKTHPAASQPRLDRLHHADEKDVYGQRGKLSDPSACPSCGAMFRDGRWQWGAPPVGAEEHKCPACRRIEDDYPAGIVHLAGEFAQEHRGEIEGLIRNLEEREKKERPLNRIMAMRDEGAGLAVTTTSWHLARAIGEALHHAYQGELDYDPAEAETLLRVRWER